jgi:hypothetical protein
MKKEDQVLNIEIMSAAFYRFLSKISSSDYCFVIEATGNYSSRLLHFSIGKRI